MEKRWTGPDSLIIKGLNTGTLDLTQNNWGHEVGVNGEKLQLYTEEGAQTVLGTPTTWYKEMIPLLSPWTRCRRTLLDQRK